VSETEERKAYWGVVEDCLVFFHDMSKASAHGKTNALRRRIDENLRGDERDFFFHSEPFYVACDVAGMHEVEDQERLLAGCADRYMRIKQSRGW
jgi:hypothetical protein